MTDKALLIDIETAKMLMEHLEYDRKLYSPFLKSEYIKRPRWIPCASWKIHGKGGIQSVSVLDFPKRFKKNYFDDYDVIRVLSEVINENEYFIGHNGDNFDWKIITARMLYHGFTPPARLQKIDTLKIARSEFKLEANDLRYLSWYLKLPDKKMRAPDWDLVSMGDSKEIAYCLTYNRQDIRVLEQVYNRLIPFAKAKLHYGEGECPACGSKQYQSKGSFGCTPGKWRYKCSIKACGRNWTAKPPKGKR